MKSDICGSETLAKESAARGHPGLNQGPLDLQSNALPLSYIPDREKRFPADIDVCMVKSIFHVRARANLTTAFVFVQKRISCHIYRQNPSKIVFALEKHQKRNKLQCEKKQKKASSCLKFDMRRMHSRDRIVVSTLRCGRNNPGSNPGHGRAVDDSVTAKPADFYY